LQLTVLGRAYYEGCKRLLEQYTELELSLRQAQGERALTVRVAAIFSVGLGDMGQYVERFQVDNRNAKVQLEYLHPDQVYHRVRDDLADFGLVSFPSRSRELTVLSWREEEMVVVFAPGHSLSRSKRINPARLNGEKYVAFDKRLSFARWIVFATRASDRRRVRVTVENIKKAVEVGTGFAAARADDSPELKAGTLLACDWTNQDGAASASSTAASTAGIARFHQLVTDNRTGVNEVCNMTISYLPVAPGLYDPRHEHDACGVGFAPI
jgi:DNA-binding transcriptional LysR family regulator